MGRTAMQPQQQRPQRKDRTGMYVVVGFLALIALVAGAIMLFNVLAKESPSEFAMPNVVGAKLEDGVKTLQDAGLVPNPVEEADPAVAAGNIGRTEPVADTLVKKGQTVDVFFTAAVTPFVLEDMAGKTQADALAALQLLGLTVDPTIITENNPDVPAGTVIRTDPPAGTTMQQGDTIKLVVSAGPNQVAIPPTEGLSQANATALLTSEAFGFTVTTQQEASTTQPVGSSTRTDPAGGTLVAKGSAVVLFISTGPDKVRVPPLVGLTEAQAQQKLTQLNLLPDVRTQSVPFGDPNDGRVISQNPSQGVEVLPGATVKLTVAKALPAPTTTLPPPTTPAPTAPPTTLPPTTTAATTTTTLP
jgi:serine/threonine-protein kinase